MKLIAFFILIFIIFFINLNSNLKSQPPCQSSTISYFYSVPLLQNYPPLNSGMPLETIVGYIVADSVSKSLSIDTLHKFIQSLTFNDTLNYLMKYYYWMVDYNPIQYLQYAINPPYKYVKPRFIEEDLNRQIWNTTKNVPLDLIIEAYYILHIFVNDTNIVGYNNGTGYGCKNMTVVSSQIIDTIKGQVIPTIDTKNNNIVNKNNLSLQNIINQIKYYNP